MNTERHNCRRLIALPVGCTTWFLDTPGFELQRANVILRVREESEARKPFKVTLKFRAPDRLHRGPL